MQNNICKVSCKYKNKTHTYSVQFRPSVVSDSLRPHVLQHTRPPRPVTNSRSPPKPMSVESVMPSSHLILCCPLLLLPSTFPSIRVFSNASALLIRSSFSRVQLFATPWTEARQASPSLLKFMSIELVMPPNHLILCCPLLLLPSIFPSIKVFSNESALHCRWPKYHLCIRRLSYQGSPKLALHCLISHFQ